MNFRKGQPALSLDGEWSLAYDFEDTHFDKIADLEASGLAIRPATVPGNFELDLLANGEIEEPFQGMNIADLTRFERARIWYSAASPPKRRKIRSRS
jgi:beta-mannosidase